jgi:Transglycosylase-like domain
VEELVASRRRVWFGMIMVVAFGLLMVAALLPAPSKVLRVDQAGADETIPDTSVIAATDIAQVTPTTAATPTTRVPAPAPSTTTSTTAAPVTTTTTAPPKQAFSLTAVAPVAVASPAPGPAPAPSEAAFLACIRNRESHGNYQTVSASGDYRGAYQFNQPAWDATAQHAGRPDLVGQLANLVSPADQDAMALTLYHWQGSAPWGGACD